MKLVKKVKGGTVKTKVTLKSNHPKEEIGSEEDSRQLGLPFEVPAGHEVGVVKWTENFSTSHGFQTFGVSVGIELPVSMKPGDLKALKAMFPKAEALCDAVMAEKIKEAPAILDRLVGLKKKMSSNPRG